MNESTTIIPDNTGSDLVAFWASIEGPPPGEPRVWFEEYPIVAWRLVVGAEGVLETDPIVYEDGAKDTVWCIRNRFGRWCFVHDATVGSAVEAIEHAKPMLKARGEKL